MKTIKTNLEINLKFLDGLGDGWVTVIMILQGNGNLKRMNLIELYGELKAQESTVMQQHQKIGGPLALAVQISLGFNPNEQYPSIEYYKE